MSADVNRKTLRHFYCRDALWHSFERMSEDFDRGSDDLINEAMRLFAREKGYLPTESEVRSVPVPPRGAPPPPARTVPGIPNRTPAPPPPGPAGLRSTAHFQGVRPPAQPATSHRGGEDETTPDPTMGATSTPLYVIFENKKYLVDKDQFIIGRGSKSSDLAIRDGNVSRKHAAVIRRNGAYFMKDLGSTNGVDFNGTRVDNKRIEEGDRYMICDYEIRFTYR